MDSHRLDNFRRRVVQDALAEATRDYWLRRAADFEAARPTRLDYAGRATAADLAEADRRCRETARACRAAAVETDDHRRDRDVGARWAA